LQGRGERGKRGRDDKEGGCRVEGSGGKLRRWRETEEGSIGRG